MKSDNGQFSCFSQRSFLKGLFPKPLTKAKTFRLSGDYSKAICILEQLLDELQDEHRFLEIACLNELSQCLWRKGQPPEAIIQAQKALELAEQVPSDMAGLGNALSNLGVSHWQLGKLDIAERYLQRFAVWLRGQ